MANYVVKAKCPCSSNNHLGISTFEVNLTKKPLSSKIHDRVKKFFMGNGIEINDNIEEAKDILLNRDHQDILSLGTNYHKGKLGLKMIPPVFFSKFPDVFKPEDYKVKKGREIPGKLVGELVEKEVFDKLKSYYENSGYDVVILHSHKFLTEVDTSEKDFIIINLSLGYIMQLEVKANVKKYQSSIKQFIDGRQKLNSVLNSIKICRYEWRYVGVFYAQKDSEMPLFNCKLCLDFAIIGLHNLEPQLEDIEAKIQRIIPDWNPANHTEDFIELNKELMYMTQGHHEAPVTKSNLFKNVVKNIDKSGTVENILFWTPQQLSVINAMNERFMIFYSFYGTGKTLLLKERAKYLLKKCPGETIYFFVHEAFNLSASMYPDNELFPGGILKDRSCTLAHILTEEFKNTRVKIVPLQTLPYGESFIQQFEKLEITETQCHVIIDEMIVTNIEEFSKEIKELKLNVATLWVAIGSSMLTNDKGNALGSLLRNEFFCPELKYVARSTSSIAQMSLELAKTENLAILKLVNDIDIYQTNINKGMVYNVEEIEESPINALEIALEFVPWNESALIFLQWEGEPLTLVPDIETNYPNILFAGTGSSIDQNLITKWLLNPSKKKGKHLLLLDGYADQSGLQGVECNILIYILPSDKEPSSILTSRAKATLIITKYDSGYVTK